MRKPSGKIRMNSAGEMARPARNQSPNGVQPNRVASGGHADDKHGEYSGEMSGSEK